MLFDHNGQFLIPFFLEGLWIKGINPTGTGLVVGTFSYPAQRVLEKWDQDSPYSGTLSPGSMLPG